MVQISDIYRVLEPDETILPTDEFTLSTLNDCWGCVDKFAGQRVRNVCNNGKVIFRRLVVRENLVS